MRLPYGVQATRRTRQRSLEFIRPDETLVVDVKPATDAMVEAGRAGGLLGSEREDFVGNIKARQRMVAQYVVAGARGGWSSGRTTRRRR